MVFIFVIDSPQMALLANIYLHKIFNHSEGHYKFIFELKNNIDTDPNFVNAAKLILGNLITSFEMIRVPSPYFLTTNNPISRIKKLILFRKSISTKYKIDPNVIYVGSKTSSILCCVDSSRKILFDHGSGDYYSRLNARKNTLLSFSYLWYRLINLLQLPDLSHSKCVKGYTLSMFKSDTFAHLSVSDFVPNSTLLQTLNPIPLKALNHNSKCRIVLVLVSSNGHTESGFDGDTSKCNHPNVMNIIKSCDKNDLIFIKYHPAIYRSSKKITNLDVAMLDHGFIVYDIDCLFPTELKGHIPVELIATLCHFDLLVAEESSAIWNLTYQNDIKLVSNPSLFDIYLNRNGKYVDIVNFLKSLLHKPDIVETIDK
jgi:hypothetical protein